MAVTIPIEEQVENLGVPSVPQATSLPGTLNYDPEKPVYAAPDIQKEDVPLHADPAKATVEGRMNGILARNSDFAKVNAANAMQDMNKRGLLNSSMAVGAARKAVIESALPIAQQDAKLYGDAAINDQVGTIEHNKMMDNARLTGALTEQDYQGKYELQKATDAAQLRRVELDNRWKQEINFDSMETERQRAVLAVQQQIGAELTGGIERIMRDPNIEDKEAAIAALMDQYQSQLSTAAAIAGIDLTWE